VTKLRYRIAYGIVENPARVLAMQAAAIATDESFLSPSFASFASDDPGLRLNSAGWMSLPAETMATLRTHDALKDYCRRRVEKKASIFDRPLQDFLRSYLGVVADEVRDHAAHLPGGASWDEALTSTDDWFFSAFLPLPNAHLELTDAERLSVGTDGPIRFDAIFSTGTSLVAVTLDRISTQTPRQRETRSRFAALRPDIAFVTIPTGTGEKELPSLLPDICKAFWRGLHLPLGPYRPDAFRWRP
jgi:hypothetical protein